MKYLRLLILLTTHIANPSVKNGHIDIVSLNKRRNRFKIKYDLRKREEVFKRDGYKCLYCKKELVSWNMLNEYSEICQNLALKLYVRGSVTSEWFQRYSPYHVLRKSDWYFWNGATLDHIIPVSKGGLDTDENLTTCCQSCNIFKSNK